MNIKHQNLNLKQLLLLVKKKKAIVAANIAAN